AADGWPESAPRSRRRRTGSRCAHADLASQIGSWLILAGMAGFFSELLSKLRADKADAPLIPINSVLASKLLDVDFCLSKLNSQESLSRSFYIPHYDPAKNIEQVSSTLPSLKLDMPEFGLLGIAEHLPCRVFFGLTSSIIILVELLLRRNSSHNFELVFAGQESCQNSRHEELMRFKSLLSRYSGHVELRHHNISIVLAGEILI
ncbi:MAG: hypothetical protein ACK55R_07580, partial [Cyanobacteriota bacterium]